MGIEGVDYAWARPNLDQLWAANIRFVCRYLAYLPNGKVLQTAERSALHRKGFLILLNWEQAAGDMLKGYNTGVSHAREALRQANALGAPGTLPIYFSCDTDTSNFSAVGAYLDGAASVIGRSRVGLYGSFKIIEALCPTKAPWGWQTYAWSGGKVSGKAHFIQYKNGVTLGGAVGGVDRDRSLKDNFGAWAPNGSVGTGNAVPAVEEEDEPMGNSWTQPLTQGTPGYAGQQRDTALAFTWQAAAQAAATAAENNAMLKALTTAHPDISDEDMAQVRDEARAGALAGAQAASAGIVQSVLDGLSEGQALTKADVQEALESVFGKLSTPDA